MKELESSIGGVWILNGMAQGTCCLTYGITQKLFTNLQQDFSQMTHRKKASLIEHNLIPRSHSVTGNVTSGKVRFRACSVPARPEIQAFLSLRMFVLSVVILGDFVE